MQNDKHVREQDFINSQQLSFSLQTRQSITCLQSSPIIHPGFWCVLVPSLFHTGPTAFSRTFLVLWHLHVWGSTVELWVYHMSKSRYCWDLAFQRLITNHFITLCFCFLSNPVQTGPTMFLQTMQWIVSPSISFSLTLTLTLSYFCSFCFIVYCSNRLGSITFSFRDWRWTRPSPEWWQSLAQD